MATVGLSTFSITKLKGSVRPVSSSASRSPISGSNLEKRSGTGGGEPLQRIHQLADRLDLGLHVHRDDDVELVLDAGDEVEHREAVPLEVLGEARSFGDGDTFLIVRRDELDGSGVDLLAVGHAPLVSAAPQPSQSNGARLRRFGAAA